MLKRTAIATYAGLAVARSVSMYAAPAKASEMTLSDLRDLCSGSDAGAQAACKFYIRGAFEGLSLGGSAKAQKGQLVEKSSGKQFCVPDDMAGSVMRAKVMALVERDPKAYPADALMPAISFIAAAITLAYPCH